MNPFDLRGPEFLVFYIILVAAVIITLVLARRVFESAGATRIDLGDPYLIASLRSGDDEVLRVALVSLIDRGLVIVNGTQIRRADHADLGLVRRDIERKLMEKLATPHEAVTIFRDPKLKLACEQFRETLETHRLLPDESVTMGRWMLLAGAILIIVGVGGAKVFVALQRGRTNVSFLIGLMVIGTVLAARKSFPRLTATGQALLTDVQTLYGGLKDRAITIRPGGATIDAIMLAAAFGVGALAGDAFAYTNTLFPRAQPSAGWSSGSSWSSSCSSSSCSSGSSCGGGGCGGGCGGCGS